MGSDIRSGYLVLLWGRISALDIWCCYGFRYPPRISGVAMGSDIRPGYLVLLWAQISAADIWCCYGVRYHI
jgi:hypothetical protein